MSSTEEMYKTGPKDGRLEARVSIEQQHLFKRAAQLKGITLTDFIVSTLQTEATKVIHNHEILELAKEDREIFVSALLNPEIPIGRLKEAIIRFKKTMD
jgi:uncharacterized protein (DUF1778 family)